MADFGACQPIHQEALAVGRDELRVFRCSWGWCVKRGDEAFRSRMLLDAFEDACGARLEEPVVRDLVGTIERALNAEYARKASTASTIVTLPGETSQRVPPPVANA